MEEPFLKFLRNSYEFFDETIPGGTEFPTNEIILLPPPPPPFSIRFHLARLEKSRIRSNFAKFLAWNTKKEKNGG